MFYFEVENFVLRGREPRNDLPFQFQSRREAEERMQRSMSSYLLHSSFPFLSRIERSQDEEIKSFFDEIEKMWEEFE